MKTKSKSKTVNTEWSDLAKSIDTQKAQLKMAKASQRLKKSKYEQLERQLESLEKTREKLDDLLEIALRDRVTVNEAVATIENDLEEMTEQLKSTPKYIQED